jgi:hypothetical protein
MKTIEKMTRTTALNHTRETLRRTKHARHYAVGDAEVLAIGSLVEDVIAGKKKLREAQKIAKARRGKTKPKVEKPLRQRVEANFVKFMEKFAVSEYREVREILRELLANCER